MVVFFLIVPPPPRSTLFPYTTLFRSALAWVRHARPGDDLPDLVVNPYRPGRVEPRAVKRRPKEYDRDRKSTRLNSSHMSISYAVFCLKKKKDIHFQNTALHIINQDTL